MRYEIDTRKIDFKSGRDTVQAYLATPQGKGTFPGLVVIHEWWGLNDWVRSQADALAREGYVAFAVDLYRGRVTTDPMEAHELSRALPEDRALRDLKAGFNYLRQLPPTRGKPLGVIGWCMGGSWSLTLAIEEPRLRAWSSTMDVYSPRRVCCSASSVLCWASSETATGGYPSSWCGRLRTR